MGMMTLMRTFSMEDEEKTLLSEELFNANDQSVKLRRIEGQSVIETRREYHQNGNIILEISLQDNEEHERVENRYDEADRVISEHFYISGELYQEIYHRYSSNGFERMTMEEGIETEKLVKLVDGKNYVNEFYQDQELAERHVYQYNSSEHFGELIIRDEEGEQYFRVESWYDKNDQLIAEKEYNAEDILMVETTNEYDGKLLRTQAIKDFTNGADIKINSFEYDEAQRITKTESRDEEGNLHEFHLRQYNSEGRLVEERGFATGSFNAIYGTQVDGKNFHLVHEYSKWE